MPKVIDYHQGGDEAKRRAARRDRAVWWFVLALASVIIAVSIFLYTFPARLIDVQGYTR